MTSEILHSESKWSAGRKYIFLFGFCYVILFIGSFSFPHPLVPDIGKYFAPVFERLARFTGETVFNTDDKAVYSLVSDSAGLYLHAFNLALISALIGWLWLCAFRDKIDYGKMQYWFFVLVRYYLALHLLSYGFTKIFKWQFFFPEPNTLYTPLGKIPKDLLYWSTMGVSRGYSMFLGVAEIMAGSLLFFRRTALLGAFLSLMIFINVLCVNLSYDISVKLFSAFLLLLSIVLILPHGKPLADFFFRKRTAQVTLGHRPSINRWLYAGVKSFAVGWIFLSSLWWYVSSGNYNGDTSPRPFLHGAYSTVSFIAGGDTLLPLMTDTFYWKRVFVHSQNYFIVQSMNDELTDFRLSTDTLNAALHLLDYVNSKSSVLNYELKNDTLLHVWGDFYGREVNVRLKKEDLSGLRLAKDEFRWTIGER